MAGLPRTLLSVVGRDIVFTVLIQNRVDPSVAVRVIWLRTLFGV